MPLLRLQSSDRGEIHDVSRDRTLTQVLPQAQKLCFYGSGTFGAFGGVITSFDRVKFLPSPPNPSQVLLPSFLFGNTFLECVPGSGGISLDRDPQSGILSWKVFLFGHTLLECVPGSGRISPADEKSMHVWCPLVSVGSIPASFDTSARRAEPQKVNPLKTRLNNPQEDL